MTMQEPLENSKHNKVLIRWHKEFAEVQKEILNIGPFRKGSICKVWNVCGNPRCRCKKSDKFHHGPYMCARRRNFASKVEGIRAKRILFQAVGEQIRNYLAGKLMRLVGRYQTFRVSPDGAPFAWKRRIYRPLGGLLKRSQAKWQPLRRSRQHESKDWEHWKRTSVSG